MHPWFHLVSHTGLPFRFSLEESRIPRRRAPAGYCEKNSRRSDQGQQPGQQPADRRQAVARRRLVYGFAGLYVLDNFGAFLIGQRDQTGFFQRAAEAGDAFTEEVQGELLQAGHYADVIAFHVEEDRARYRILAGQDGVDRRGHARHGGYLEAVAVGFVEAEAEYPQGVALCLQAGQGLGVVAGDFNNASVRAQGAAGGFAGVAVERLDLVEGFTTGVDHVQIVHFARAVVVGRDGQDDFLIRQAGVDFAPAGVGIGHQLAVLRYLGSLRREDVLRLQFERAGIGARGKHDAVVTEFHFDHLLDTLAFTGFDFSGRNGTRSIGDVDGVHTDAGAELTHTATGAAGADDRGAELGVGVAELFGDDGSKRQYGGRTRRLNGFAGQGLG